MKNNLIAAAFLLAVSAAGADIILNGGKLVPVRSSMVESFGDDMNFCFATNYSDGQIHLNHSKGVHTISEYQCADISYDNGKTWQSGKGKTIIGFTAWETPDGAKMAAGGWSGDRKKIHDITVQHIAKDGKYTVTKSTIELPYKSSYRMHRDVIRLKDNTLLATVYGFAENEKKLHNFVVSSADEGRTWKYLSLLANDPEGKTVEGPNEAAICLLADNSVMAVWRDGGYMKYAYSYDNGKTWTNRGEYRGIPMAVSPHMRLLKNGTLVIITGRPNTHLLVDFTGTGKNFQIVDVYKGGGTSYGSVLEIEPNRVLVIHDESTFVGVSSPTPFSRIMADVYDVVKDASIRIGSGDPRAKDYDVFYSAYDKQTPHEAIKAVFFDYIDKKNKPDMQGPASFEILQIPERPAPVLRIVSRGDNKIKPASEWATIRYNSLKRDVTKISTSFEVRIMDNDTDKAQFMVTVYPPDTATSGHSFSGAYVHVAKDFVKFGGKTVLRENMLNRFVAFEMRTDTIQKKAWLYKKGDTKPLGEVKLQHNNNTMPGVWWGDGSGQIYGTADLSYIGIKYNK